MAGAVAASLAVVAVGTSASAEAASPHVLRAGHPLGIGQRVTSDDGRYALTVKPDGDAVERKGSRTVWASHTGTTRAAARGTRLALHRDGSVAVLRRSGTVVWRSKAALARTTRLSLTDSGRFVLAAPHDRVTLNALAIRPAAAVVPSTAPDPIVATPTSEPQPAASASTGGAAPATDLPAAAAPVADAAPAASVPVQAAASAVVPEVAAASTPAITPTAPVVPVPAPEAVVAAPVTTPVQAAPVVTGVSGFTLTTSFVGGGSTVNLRSAPSTGAVVAGTRSIGTAISIVCQTVGGMVGTGTYAQNRTWDLLAGGESGTYVHDVLTTTPGGARTNLADGGYAAFSSAIPRCPDAVVTPAAASNAVVAWAAAQVGKNRADAADAAGFSDWAPGPYGEWSGDCAKFVIAAWRHAGHEIAHGNAAQQYQAYAGRISTGAAPAGALVFYPNVAPPFGHIAISDGNGNVYTTQGMDKDDLAIALKPVGSFGAPAGWTMPFGL